jgi:regulation of enolase protein 1 (concanavalin A-like superfamily)
MRIAALALLTLCALPQDKVLFEEKFQKKLSDGWTWVREDKKGWKLSEAAIEIRALPGSLKGKENTAKNLLLRKAPPASPDTPFAIEATVKSAPAQAGEQAGVIVYENDDSYVSFVREHKDGKVFVRMIREMGGEEIVWAEKELEGEAHALRILHMGNKIQAEVMTGQPAMWMPAYYGEPPFKGEVKAGLAAFGAPAGAERWAKFTGVRLVQPEVRR